MRRFSALGILAVWMFYPSASFATPIVLPQVWRNPKPAEYDLFGTSVAINANNVAASSSTGVFVMETDGSSVLQIGATPGQVAFVNNHLAVANGTRVDVYDYRTGQRLRTIDDPDNGVQGFGTRIFAPKHAVSAELLVTGTNDNVHLFDVNNGELIRTLANPTPRERGFGRALAMYGQKIVVSSGYGDQTASVHVFEATTGELLDSIASPQALNGFGSAVALTDSRLFIAAPYEYLGNPESEFALGKVYGFDLTTGDFDLAIVNTKPGDFSRGIKTDDFFGASLAVDNGLLVVGVDGNAIEHVAHVFATGSGEHVYSLDNSNFPMHFGPVDVYGSTIVIGDTTNSRFAGATYVRTVPEPNSLLIWMMLICLIGGNNRVFRRRLDSHPIR